MRRRLAPREAHGDLTAPGAGPGQQEVSDIRTRKDQHQRERGE
jgi:hypothetical protein